MRPPPPKAIALSGRQAIIAADPSVLTCFKNSRRSVKFVVMFPPLVSGLTVPYPQRFPPVLPAREFYILGPLRPPVRLRSLIIVSLMRERELPKKCNPAPKEDCSRTPLRADSGARWNEMETPLRK